jgi:hypothetical protein
MGRVVLRFEYLGVRDAARVKPRLTQVQVNLGFPWVLKRPGFGVTPGFLSLFLQNPGYKVLGEKCIISTDFKRLIQSIKTNVPLEEFPRIMAILSRSILDYLFSQCSFRK